ncbi:MAG TPA: hypothetical protein ENI27_03725 [bacterium]|nr:hypothetical protein [bacterium]
MRLNHSSLLGDTGFFFSVNLGFFLFLVLGLFGCTAPQATQGVMEVIVRADGQRIDLKVPAGSTVQQVLDLADLALGSLDRVDPPSYTLLTDEAVVRVIRVREEFVVEQEIIPFEQQILHTETLPDQERLLAQGGENGLMETTYRHVYEDDVEVSLTPVKWVEVKSPVPEIIMVGIQTLFNPVPIPGRLVFLLGSNAWMMEQTTGNRRPIITTGDLDGLIFSLSPDGSWLLFTRQSKDEDQINALWAAQIATDSDQAELFDLEVANVVHFADWVPGSTETKVAFSTVEPRSTAPGWQANNDLNLLTFTNSGWVSSWTTILEANYGGVYGWWGMSFEWEPSGERLAYARSDGVGLLDLEEAILRPRLEIVSLQTGGDWAWVPGLTWGPDGKTLYTVDHVSPSGSEKPEESQLFDITAIPLEAGAPVHMVPQAGMFAYPVTSPLQPKGSSENAYLVAYLQAVFPTQSKSSRYHLVVMDRDGSNRRVLFPLEGELGLEPQRVVWSPAPMMDDEYSLAVVYQGNLWLLDVTSGRAQQITGDGLTNRLSWRLYESQSLSD